MRQLTVTLAALLTIGAAYAQGSAFPGTGNKEDWLKANGYFNVGTQLFQAKKFKEAVPKYEEAIKIYPHDFHYHYSLGMAQKKSGNLNAAIDAFKAAIEINGKDWKTWKAMSNSLYQLGRYSEARDSFAKTLECKPPANEVTEIQKLIANIDAQKSAR
ncbi:MAG TPA: tetratricopeptide repeat protein [Candidatus Obscuribacterales bacterium]